MFTFVPDDLEMVPRAGQHSAQKLWLKPTVVMGFGTHGHPVLYTSSSPQYSPPTLPHETSPPDLFYVIASGFGPGCLWDLWGRSFSYRVFLVKLSAHKTFITLSPSNSVYLLGVQKLSITPARGLGSTPV